MNVIVKRMIFTSLTVQYAESANKTSHNLGSLPDVLMVSGGRKAIKKLLRAFYSGQMISYFVMVEVRVRSNR